MKYTSVDIIYNPNSTGPSHDYAKDLRNDLKKSFSKIKVRLRATEYAGHAEKLAYKISLSSKYPLIISSSGDGGYNEIVNGAIRAQSEGANPVCAILAAGNANDHSRTLISRPVLELIKANKVKNIDLLKVSIQSEDDMLERFAHSYVGMGLTPVIASNLNKTKLNAFNEIWIVLKTSFRYRPFKIKHEDKTVTLDSIIFANIGEMAKVLTISKSSKPDDGLFEVIIFMHAHKRHLLHKLAKASLTGLETESRHKEYKFKVLKKTPMQLDGEVLDVAKNSTITITSEMKAFKTLID